MDEDGYLSRRIRIIEPHWRTAIEQVIGRAVRIHNHTHLPLTDHMIEVYTRLCQQYNQEDYVQIKAPKFVFWNGGRLNKHIIGNNLCPLLQKKIEINESYMTCRICHVNFDGDIITFILKKKEQCPCCKSKWTDFNTYINIPSSIVEKHITEHEICPITQVEIEKNSKYMTCNICHHNYEEEQLKDWIKYNNTCPICRSIWVDNTVYKNIETSDKKNIQQKYRKNRKLVDVIKPEYLYKKKEVHKPFTHINMIFNKRNKHFFNRR